MKNKVGSKGAPRSGCKNFASRGGKCMRRRNPKRISIRDIYELGE
jgi:hypothetical protein